MVQRSWRDALAVVAGAVMVVSVSTAVNAGPKKRKTPLVLGLAPARADYTTTPRANRPMGKAPIRNFGEVSAGCIYRSGQPGEDGYRWLREQGFKSIVCLRKEHDDGAERMKQYGFSYLHLPIVDETAPTMEQAETFLKFAAERQNWPLLVHCHGGEGRAATIAALVRYNFDGWAMSLALREAANYRIMRWLRGGKLCREQREFLKEWAARHPAGALRPRAESAASEEKGGDL